MDLTTLFDRYDTAARNSLDRWRQSILKIQANTYTQDDYFRDSVYVWLQSTLGMWGPWLDILQAKAIVEIKKGTDTAQGSTAVAATAQGQPTASALKLTKAGEKAPANTPQEIPVGSVVAELNADRKTLTVKLSNLNGLGLHVGNQYAGEVTVGAIKVADVVAYVKA